MPETWTPEKNERLLLVALEAGMIDCNKLAARWTLKYGSSFFPHHPDPAIFPFPIQD